MQLEWQTYQVVKKFDDMLSHFETKRCWSMSLQRHFQAPRALITIWSRRRRPGNSSSGAIWRTDATWSSLLRANGWRTDRCLCYCCFRCCCCSWWWWWWGMWTSAGVAETILVQMLHTLYNCPSIQKLQSNRNGIAAPYSGIAPQMLIVIRLHSSVKSAIYLLFYWTTEAKKIDRSAFCRSVFAKVAHIFFTARRYA